jgi:hypothetical protein
MYNSQIQQDKFVNEYLNKDNGFFVDIGAGTSGIHNMPVGFYSNTYFFESRGWTGIAIDYDKIYIDSVKNQRNCSCVCEDLMVTNINNILENYNCPELSDYLSFDVDEASEKVLLDLDLSKYKFRVITFEHNIYQTESDIFSKNSQEAYRRLYNISREKFKDYGYTLYKPDVVLSGYGSVEDWYIL